MKYAPIAVLVLLTGCALGPNYHRPEVGVPQTFHAPAPLPAQTAESLANLKWFEVFKDEKLHELIRTSLAQNYDLRAAVANVMAARANLGVTRSNQFPNVAAGGEIEVNRLSRNGTFPLSEAFVPSQNRNWGQASFQLLSFELDIWGRLRRATEAAQANLLTDICLPVV